MRKQLSLSAISLLFLLFSCKKLQKTPEYYSTVAQYVAAYTSGSVSSKEVVKVRFVNPAVGTDQVGKPVDASVFSLSPAVKGEAKWADERTLLFTPDEPFERGKKVVASLNLGKLFKGVPKLASVFEWDFMARALDFNVLVDGLRAADDLDLKRQQIIGRIRTSDVADAAKVEEVLTASQNGKSLKINWLHTPDGLIHDFTVMEVVRGEAPSKVGLAWDGGPLSVSKTEKMEVEIPALGDFKVLDVRIQTEEELCAVVHFSDPILSSQDLKGLISMTGWDGDFRFVIDRNFVKCFPTKRVTGNFKMKISPGIKNTAGAAMKGQQEFDVRWEDLKPALRLVGKGSIIPNSNGTILFPFEAVSLKAVDVEIFKIYNSNILQFLQTNDLEGDGELERVGKILMQKKVTLSELNPLGSSSGWSRYALDLRSIIDSDPGAIYQIRLAFRPSYTDFKGGGDMAWAAENDGPPLGFADEFGNLNGIFGNQYYGLFPPDGVDGGDWEGDEGGDGEEFRYDYGNRENPAKPEFYNAQHFIKRNAFVSNLGLTAKRGNDGSTFVAATDLLTTEPAGGVRLEFYNYQLQKIAESSTGSDGLCQTEVKMPPYLLVASRGNEKGYVKMDDGSSLSMSRFDVEGSAPQKGLKGFIYGERGVWRPGDSIFLHFMLEDKEGKLPAGHPVSFKLRDSRGQLAATRTISSGTGGIFPFHCATRPEAATGNWMATVKVGGAIFQKSLKIETVKPNRLKLNLDFGKKEFSKNDADGFSGKLQVNWLHGSPGKNLAAKVELQMQSTTTTFPNQKETIFDDPARRFWGEPQVIFDQAVDANGQANITGKLETNGNAPGKLICNFKVRAFERGGDFSTDQFSMDYLPYDTYIGVKIPTDRWGSKSIDPKNGGEITVVAIDRKGNLLANHKIAVGLYRVDWRWWWDGDEQNYSQFNSAEHVGSVDQTTLTTNSRGEATWKIRPNFGDWGRYLVRAADPVGGHAAGDFFYSGWPEGQDNIQARNYAAYLPFAADKEKYVAGETVSLKIPGGETGRVLVTLENGSRVVKSFWQATKQGENTLTFQATADMAPTIYAHVSLTQPHAQTKNDLPIRLYGVIPINVENLQTHLLPQISMPEVIKPEENFTVSVSEKDGRAMAYTVDVVDEGLLDLTRFETPDPWKAFYAREGLGVKTWDMYDYVLGAYGAELSRILAIGGDDFNQKARSGAQVNRFKPVVKHLGPFLLDKGKTNRHTIKIENYVGSVRAMVVACGQSAYGSADKTAPVRKPVMILPTLPRVLGPGEKLTLPVAVFAMEDKVKNVQVSVEESSGLISILGEKTKSLNFSKPGDDLVNFSLQVAADQVGVARFKIRATGGGESVESEQEILVGNPNPYVTTVEQGESAAGQAWSKSYEAFGPGSQSKAVLEVSALPPINLQQHLDFLIRYPHGCAEQTVSAAFPQLFVDNLMNLNKKQQDEVAKNVKAAIEKLTRFQTTDGGYSYWPGNNYGDGWCSNYVGQFLLEAKNLGYEVPQAALTAWISSQTKLAKQWDFTADSRDGWSRRDDELTQGYRLYTLALAGQPELGAMNRMRERPKLYRIAAHSLAGAYALAGKSEVGQQLISEAKFSEDWNYNGWCGWSYGSWLRDAAMMLETYTALADKGRADSKMGEIVAALGRENYWYGTQDRSFALAALSRFSRKFNASTNGAINFSYKNGGAAQAVSSDKMVAQVEFSIGKTGSTVVVKNTGGSGKLYYRLILNGQPAVGNEPSKAENLTLAVKYVDAKGTAVDPQILTSGTDFFAEITASHQNGLHFGFNDLALTSVFPGGWEITNSRLSNFAAKSNSSTQSIDYQDFRDDRVLTYFRLPYHHKQPQSRTIKVGLTAAYPGRFYLPTMICESMYDRRILAQIPGRWVEVVANDGRNQQ